MLVAFQNHRHLFERCIACPLANTVDGDLHLTRTVQHTRHGVGRSHAQVVVAVRGEDGVVYTIYMFHQIFNLLAILRRQTVARRVGDVHHRGTRLDDGFHYAGQILVVRASGIFGIELHVVYIFLGILHGRYCPFDNFLPVRIELIFDMFVTRSYTGMDTLVLGILQGICCHINILLHGTGQGTNRGPRHRL